MPPLVATPGCPPPRLPPPPQDAELAFVSTGNTKDLSRWLEFTGFPAERAFLDPEAKIYSSLKTRKGVMRTLLHPYVSGRADERTSVLGFAALA